jgi:hypothetical protein
VATPELHTYQVIGIYRDRSGTYVDDIVAASPKEAWHFAQMNAIYHNTKPALTTSERALLLQVGWGTNWDFTNPTLQKYSDCALDHVATYQVVEPGTVGAHTLKLME